MRWARHRLTVGVWGLGVMLLISGCDLRLERPMVEEIREKGSLVVVTRNAPTTYYEGRDQKIVGFEHDLAVAFGEYLGVPVKFKVLSSRQAILDAILTGEGDLAAAGLSIFPDKKGQFRFGPAYQEVDQQVVCLRGGRRPRNLLQLARVDLVIEEGGTTPKRLEELKSIVPNLTWSVAPGLSAEQILEKVSLGEMDCTIVDSNIVAINRRYFPELVVKFPLGASTSLGWVLPRRAILLSRELTAWFNKMKKTGQLEAIFERYYGHIDYYHQDYDYVDNRSFLRRIKERLPHYESLFRMAGEKYNVPWKLLAALSYQESHWDPQSTSYTGVRGLMMLTRATARAVGVDDRLDPEQSIFGGAEYLANIHRKLPETIQEPDRTWFALAAYNIGPGHLIDARELAVRQGKDPDNWNSLRTVLPLLSQEKYHATLKRGYARGSEPVRYIFKIRQYLDVLERQELTAHLTPDDE
ncbi:MAG: membrane-bound lytic murein transglycosylase MltF [Magnetococcales bacterium]|nr:membrane-bound lytic murein transglycosylase MltF [Magnetococcales bacterium]